MNRDQISGRNGVTDSHATDPTRARKSIRNKRRNASSTLPPSVLPADQAAGTAPYMPASMTRGRAKPTVILSGRIYAYARFSAKGQRTESIDRQIQNIQAYAKSRNMTIERFFEDHAVSGIKSNRSGLDELLESCALHPGSIVIVEAFDRLLRSEKEYHRIKHELNKSSTIIHDLFGHNPPLLEMVKAGMASEDRLRLLDRVAMGKIASAKQGRWIVNKIPYGYRSVGPSAIAVDEDQAEHVRLMFELKARGLNYRQISDELHERGIKPVATARWRSATLRRLVRNPVYVGWCVWNLTRPAGHA